MHLLLKSWIFPMHEFEDREAMPNKTWPIMKAFVHGAYVWQLVATNLCNTAGQQGYIQPAQNMYNVLNTNDSSNDAMTVTHTAAAATTRSTLGNTYQTQAIPQDLATAINVITANQHSLHQHIAPLMQQMAAMSFQAQQPNLAHQPTQVPPIQHLMCYFPG
jgi:hypothetical protein